ncbi:LamG-like jellyroll fold domain-containing protein [Bizionia sp. KMM 8389]
MKYLTYPTKGYAFCIAILLISSFAYAQDFNVQHIQDNIAKTGGSNTSFTPVSSTNNAIALPNNNRKTSAGRNGSSTNLSGDDLAGARVLTGTNTLTYYRQSGSVNTNMRFNTSIWEYIGPSAGDNEMIVRGRYAINLNGTSNNTTQAITGITNAKKCIPFITGIMNNTNSEDADSGTAIAYLENNNTLRVLKGSNANNVTVYITLVEFTGSNWTVLHGDSGSVSTDTGTINLKNNSDGTGTNTNVSAWSNAIIFSQHIGDTNASGTNDAIADNWPKMDPGNNDRTVDWTFNGHHDSAGTNRQFVHILTNSNLNVTRYQNYSSAAGESTINITSAGLTDINQALIVGSSTSSGTGTAYARGWRNYYLNSTTEAAHWSHRSGNTMAHEIQIVDLSGLTSSTTPAYCSSNGYDTSDEYIGNVQLNTINNSSGVGTTSTGYSDFTAISTTLNQNSTETITITPTWTGGSFSEGYSVWIDYNQDLDFNDFGEQVATIAPTNDSPVSATFTIPNTASLGSTRMRISMKFYSTPTDPCESFSFGEVEDYTINITSGTPQPEINVTGSGVSITSNDTTPNTIDDTDFGSINGGSNLDHTFTIHNDGTSTLNLTGGSPLVDISGNAAFSVVTQPSSNSIAPGGSLEFVVRFSPTVSGIVTANLSINNDDSNENPYTFRVQGTGVIDITEGPGGVTNDLALWLKGTNGLGYTNGQSVSLWADQGRGSNATVNTPGQEPTYYDTPTQNVNFNPVVAFDNTYATYSLDDDYSFDNTNTQFLEGNSGLYTQDIFIVLIPDDTPINDSFGFMDTFCGDADITTNATDATGIGMGNYTDRVDSESICFAISTYDSTIENNGYAVYDQNTTYDNVGIINARNNSSASRQELFYNANNIEYGQNDLAAFVNVNDSRYWIGRSEGWEATLNARICEIITYSSRKDDVNLTQERNRIQSYLAIKYGITLGTNGVSQDYVDSDGNIIWDANTGTPAEDVFNYDIAGIGRDDASNLLQKQSRSVNNALDGGSRSQGVLTMGIGNLADTNNLNTNTEFEDKEFLVWGNNGVDLDEPALVVDVDMSTNLSSPIAGGTHVQFNGIARTWKVVEHVDPFKDIPEVEVAILKSAVRTATPPNGRYLMFISDTPNFDPTADYRVMTEDTNELGETILKTKYDFNGTKYITFGWAPERTYKRSVYFNGSSNYVDMEDALDVNPTAFTISAWIKRDTNSLNKSIASKRDASFSEGYDIKINSSGQLEALWKTLSGTIQTTVSNTIIPENVWHQIAVIYQGGTTNLYIDGVLDKQEAKTAPNNTSHSFFIGAASKLAPQAFFNGNIDEVRVWNTALTVDQLRYIMNQEIQNNSGFVGGSYFISKGVSPTKNDIATIPWSSLAGYYPMSTYTYTNTKDESGNNNQGALRTLRTVDKQTAPLPYISNSNTAWSLNSTWFNGHQQTIPGANALVDNTQTVNWNIVETNHNISMDNGSLASANNGNRNLLALFLETNTLTVEGDNTADTGNGLTITHYFNLNGKLDLEGESQLVQTLDSDLNVGSTALLEKDQQGTRDLYTYNYWSAPVGFTSGSTINNYSYTLNNNILKDGTSSSTPRNITFVGGYDGSNSGSNIEIAHYWIWKFNNRLTDDYASWQHIRNTGTLLAGEGFTMKGVTDTRGSVNLEQNYVFQGKPNNGDVSLPINAGNEYLIGNPYPSAIDANQFITDHGPIVFGTVTDPTISGTLYFWEHWGGSSHVLSEYQGGYATYNFSGGAPAASLGSNDPDVGTGGAPTKLPGRYIPVGQGFFIASETTGNIIFNNGQRKFQVENGSASVFIRDEAYQANTVDLRMKIRLGFNSVNTIHRQILVTADQRASIEYDWGFDGLLNEEQMDEMSWVINSDNYSIQGVDTFSENTILPLYLKTSDDGLNTIIIDSLENIPDDLDIFVHDVELDIYHDLRTDGGYEIYLTANEYPNRFEITFTDENALSTDVFVESDNIQIYFENTTRNIIIHNPNLLNLKAAEMYTILGQTLIRIDNLETTNYHEIPITNLSVGTYILKIETLDGSLITKKVLVK